MIHFILNEKSISTALPPGMVILDFIRYHQHLPGTKIGCREGDCGACTVLCGEVQEDKLIYRSVTSCLMAIGNASGKHVVTIEGVNHEKFLNPVQQAMCDESATQCGFCTPGIVMSLIGFCLGQNAGNVIAAVDGNICRCTGYKSIEKAAGRVAALVNRTVEGETIPFLIERGVVPAYFNTIKNRLQTLEGVVENGSDSGTDHSNLPGRRFLAGGTDLYVQQHEAMVHSDIQFMNARSDMRSIYQHQNQCVIGGAVTISELIECSLFHSHFPEIRRFIKLVSSTPIRNMATVGGNIVNASPIGDLTIFFLALGAKLVLRRGEDTRQLPLREFYLGYKKLSREPGEYIQEIRFDLPGKDTYFNFEKVSKRTHLDIATVNTAICIHLDNNKIVSALLSAGGVGPVPAFLADTSDYLNGKELSAQLISTATQIAQTEVSPISDTRGSARYKRLLLIQLIKAHFLVLFPFLKHDELLTE